MSSIYDFSAKTIEGREQRLDAYQGKVLLIVNVASECGFTPQYSGLEALQKRYGAQGFSVLGFPSNQFGAQEPGTEAEIANFCEKNYGVTFPMFAKVEVNGDAEHPLFTWLKSEKGGLLGKQIKWNFTKFLVGRDGEVIARYAPSTEPAELVADLEKALAAQN